MGSNYSDITYSILSREMVIKIISQNYNFKHITGCRLYSQGVNDVYEIYTNEGLFYFRISQFNKRNQHQLDTEINLLISLHLNGINVVKPIFLKSGAGVCSVDQPEGIRLGILFKGIDGERITIPSQTQSWILGSNVAKVHNTMDNLSQFNGLIRFDEMELIIKSRKKVLEYALSSYNDRLHKEFNDINLTFNQIIHANLNIGICHGDIHLGNLRFNENKVHIFDFDFLNLGWRGYDISVFLWSMLFGGYDANICYSCWENFLEGYREYKTFDEKELDFVNDWLILRTMWLMGIQVEYLSNSRGVDWINNIFFDHNLKFIERVKTRRLFK